MQIVKDTGAAPKEWEECNTVCAILLQLLCESTRPSRAAGWADVPLLTQSCAEGTLRRVRTWKKQVTGVCESHLYTETPKVTRVCCECVMHTA